MPEIGMSGSMSGDGKRGVGHRPQATGPILDSTELHVRGVAAMPTAMEVLRRLRQVLGPPGADPKRAR
jgi:hypothetical protein